jgi:NTP pyrophosphatase (non-canonical NTP hydrolase)
MNATEYQQLAARTLIDKPDFTISPEDLRLTEGVLSLVVKVGLAIELLKKGVFHQHGLDRRLLRQYMRSIMALARAIYLEESPSYWENVSEQQLMIVWNTLGLVGEACEIADSVNAAVMVNELPSLSKEAGDTAWYVAALCTKLGLSLDDVLAANIEKLRKRYPNGYAPEDSKKRVDVEGL